MSDDGKWYLVIWRGQDGRQDEQWRVGADCFRGFLRSLKVLEEAWDAMMCSSQENAAYWGKER